MLAREKTVVIIKYADDTVFIGNAEGDHTATVEEFAKWCDHNFFNLNMSKQKVIRLLQR